MSNPCARLVAVKQGMGTLSEDTLAWIICFLRETLANDVASKSSPMHQPGTRYRTELHYSDLSALDLSSTSDLHDHQACNKFCS
jgi:hypothetical protein